MVQGCVQYSNGPKPKEPCATGPWTLIYRVINSSAQSRAQIMQKGTSNSYFLEVNWGSIRDVSAARKRCRLIRDKARLVKGIQNERLCWVACSPRGNVRRLPSRFTQNFGVVWRREWPDGVSSFFSRITMGYQ